MSLDRFLLRMPKVELHVHLEGSMRPAVLLELARRNGIDLPAKDEAGLKRWFRFTDFEHFVKVYLACSQALRRPEDFQLLVLDVLAEQAYQNVVHTEAHFTISTHLMNGANGGEVLVAMAEAIAEGERRYGVTLRLIPDIVRNVGVEPADRTVEWALAGRKRGIVAALGFSGSERLYPNEPFREHFATARREGLHRVAHGVRSIEAPALVEELRAAQIPLEVCPSSNVCLGVAPDVASHPFDRLYRAGVALSINSDDPAFFNTNLTLEYLRLHQTFGYSPAELAGFSLAALRQSFLPEADKATLEESFHQQFDTLGRELFGVPVEAPVS
jgi:aminodeoxyfutalosine deaminase